jgi:hypothetical protein
MMMFEVVKRYNITEARKFLSQIINSASIVSVGNNNSQSIVVPLKTWESLKKQLKDVEMEKYVLESKLAMQNSKGRFSEQEMDALLADLTE